MKWKKREIIPSKYDYIDDGSPITRICQVRDIDPNNLQDFFEPTKGMENDASLLRNGEKASRRIAQAILSGENIVSDADIDTDGITANTLLIRVLKEQYDVENIEYTYMQKEGGHGIYNKVYQPERRDSLHPLVEENKKKIENCDLLIISDSSTSDLKGLQYIKNNYDCDIIILDHHAFDQNEDGALTVADEVDKLAIVVNPQHPDDIYPNKHLSGVGVVYKVLQLVDKYFVEQYDMLAKNLEQYLDLVATGMVADMMSVREPENRYYIIQGLRNINNPGLFRILKGGNCNVKDPSTTDVGYTVAPLINASARMGQIELALELLLVDNDKEAKPLRLKMHKLNESRKDEQSKLEDYFLEKVDPTQKIIIIVDDEFKATGGFRGLVAQTIAMKYQRPCFIISHVASQGVYGGSGRSYAGFDTNVFLTESGLAQAQGHAGAHGVTIPEENLDKLIKYCNDNMPDLEDVALVYDLEIDASEYLEYMELSERFNHIAGAGFERILFRVNNINLLETDIIGSKQNTFKAQTAENLELIKFKIDGNTYGKELDFMDTVDAIGELSINVWFQRIKGGGYQKNEIPQLRMEDYRLHE